GSCSFHLPAVLASADPAAPRSLPRPPPAVPQLSPAATPSSLRTSAAAPRPPPRVHPAPSSTLRRPRRRSEEHIGQVQVSGHGLAGQLVPFASSCSNRHRLKPGGAAGPSLTGNAYLRPELLPSTG
ncbi:unnamed protein product, partial [Urochloa humidicola]